MALRQAVFGLAGLGCVFSGSAKAETYWELGNWSVTRSASSCSLNTGTIDKGSLHLQLDRGHKQATVSFVSPRLTELDETHTANLKVFFRDNQIVLTDWGGTYPFRYTKTTGDRHFYAFAPSSSYTAVLNAFSTNEFIIFTDDRENPLAAYPLRGALRGVEKLQECAAAMG